MFPNLPQHSGYNKRLRAGLCLVKKALWLLATDTDAGGMWQLPADGETLGDGRLGRIRVLRLPHPLLLGAAPVPGVHADQCAAFLWGDVVRQDVDEREVLQVMLDADEDLVAGRPGVLIIAGKGFASQEFENDLVMRGAELPRPSFKREKKRESEGPARRCGS